MPCTFLPFVPWPKYRSLCFYRQDRKSSFQFPLSKTEGSMAAVVCQNCATSMSLQRKATVAGLKLQRSEKKSSLRSSLFPFLNTKKKLITVKEELLEAIKPLNRGAAATTEDENFVNQIARELESFNPTREPLKSALLNGKWELLFTTSQSLLRKERPKLLRPFGKIYQAINNDTLRAQNMETWPFFNQVTANLTPINQRKVSVKFDRFKILGLISIKAPARARGELEITYLDEDLRISRGDKGNLFILSMVDPLYRVPLS